MCKKMSREELIDLVETIITMYDKKNQKELDAYEQDALVIKFEDNINHPGGSDLIFYPELVGLPDEASVEEIVDFAMKGILDNEDK